jgi:hypothetical protein
VDAFNIKNLMPKQNSNISDEVFHMKRLRAASKPNLSFIMLVSFLGSFTIARVFTSFFPSTVLIVQGYHIHHFWYGLALLTIGGWLGINYRDDQTERIAAIIFGVGGGLVGDEIGLLLTFGDYYSGITYTFVISLLAFTFMATLFKRHGQTIINEIFGFSRLNIDLYLGLFLAVVSLAFLIQSEDTLVVIPSSIVLIVALALILRRTISYLKALFTQRR